MSVPVEANRPAPPTRYGRIVTAASIVMVAARKCTPRSYNTHVQFDAEYPKGALYSDFYSKIYRKVYQRMTGRWYRLTIGHPSGVPVAEVTIE